MNNRITESQILIVTGNKNKDEIKLLCIFYLYLYIKHIKSIATNYKPTKLNDENSLHILQRTAYLISQLNL